MLRASHFEFWGVQGISDTPRIISPLGNPIAALVILFEGGGYVPK